VVLTIEVRRYQRGHQRLHDLQDELYRVARESFPGIPEREINERFEEYPEIVVAADGDTVAGFLFLTHHQFEENQFLGIRFIATAATSRGKGIATMLVMNPVRTAYMKHVTEKLLPGPHRRLYVVARISSPRAYFTLTRGNVGVSPDLNQADPSASVLSCRSLYQWLGDELKLVDFDQRTGIIHGGASNVGIFPQATTVPMADQLSWDAYVPAGSEALTLLPIDHVNIMRNAWRLTRSFATKYSVV